MRMELRSEVHRTRMEWPLVAARRWKERTLPELVGPRARARLVVLCVEVGGMLSKATKSSLSQLATAKANGEVPLMRRRAEQAW